MNQRKTLPGRSLECPSCREKIRYSWLSGMSGPHIHLYAQGNNDVLIRVGWVDRINWLIQTGATDYEVINELDRLLEDVPSSAVSKYSVWNNVKCPNCDTEFPYRFKGNVKMRLSDQEIVLVDGCTIDSDEGIFVIDVALST